LEFLRNGCLKGNNPCSSLPNPPPIILPYFGVVRIADKRINARPILEGDFNPNPPKTVALRSPPPNPTMPQVQDEFYAMNVDNSSSGFNLDQNRQPTFGGETPFNWDFDFVMDPVGNKSSGQVPMDIEAWSSVRIC
jgi:hypothetical protein